MKKFTIKIQNIKNGICQTENEVRVQSNEVTIGRSHENQIIISDKLASRFHAKILIEQKIPEEAPNEQGQSSEAADSETNSGEEGTAVFTLKDLDSTHGTFIGKVKLEKGSSRRIQSGAMVSFGEKNSFYFFKLCDEEGKELKTEEEADLPNEPEKPQAQVKKSEKEYLKQYAQSQRERSRLDIYKELLNKEKGFNFSVEGNQTLARLQQKSRKYEGALKDANSKKKDAKWEVNWGIVDDRDIRKKGFDDLVLDPVLLRKIPGLRIKEQNKINQFEAKLKKYRKLLKEYNSYVSGINAELKQKARLGQTANRCGVTGRAATVDFEDEGGFEMDRDGNYLQSRRAFRMAKRDAGQTVTDSTMYNKMQVKKQLEQKLEEAVATLSMSEDQLQSLLFNRNVGGQFQGGKKRTREQRKKDNRRLQEMYENLNYFDETEKKENYAKKRKTDASIQAQYEAIRGHLAAKLKSEVPEALEEQIERYALICSRMHKRPHKEVKGSLCKIVSQKLEAMEELKKVHEVGRSESYFQQVQSQLSLETKERLRREIV